MKPKKAITSIIAIGYRQQSTASVDLFINGDDVGHGALSWVMNKVRLFGFL